MKLTRLFNDFFNSEKSGGILLLICTLSSLIITNSVFRDTYTHIWHYSFAGHSTEFWINDGLMAIFFLLIGLELEREIYIGELSSPGNALLPVFAATGGMLLPACIHFLFNSGTPYQSGAGIPMATDIAFAIGILSLLGNRVPASLKIFLVALAVMDDLGAILTIAIFYSSGLSFLNLGLAMGIFAVLLLFNRLKIRNLFPYISGGILMWYFMLNSGIHATVTGVLLAFAVPFGDGGEKSSSWILQHFLHKPVAFIILPVFALANTCIFLSGNVAGTLVSGNAMGILFGLILGKPAGITLFSFIAVFLGISRLPKDLRWNHIIGVGFLGGIGFTMSIFIILLAFNDPVIVDSSKLIVLIASFLAGISGFIWLYFTLPGKIKESKNIDNF
jgi:NhaA family Na+:H+ antiporter